MNQSEVLNELKAVLCDPAGKCCITGSYGDRRIVDKCLDALEAAQAQTDHWKAAHASAMFAGEQMKAKLDAQAASKPVCWQYRWLNPENNPNTSIEATAWREVVCCNFQSLQERILELEAYQYHGEPCYEVRGLYTHPTAPHPAVMSDMLVNGEWR